MNSVYKEQLCKKKLNSKESQWIKNKMLWFFTDKEKTGKIYNDEFMKQCLEDKDMTETPIIPPQDKSPQHKSPQHKSPQHKSPQHKSPQHNNEKPKNIFEKITNIFNHTKKNKINNGGTKRKNKSHINKNKHQTRRNKMSK
jgi:hypothetical protein